MSGCGKCGHRLDVAYAQVGRRDLCPACGADLHACIQCRHHDETVAKECKEPFAEVPDNKEDGNFCDFFQLGEGTDRRGADTRAEALAAAEALFRR